MLAQHYADETRLYKCERIQQSDALNGTIFAISKSNIKTKVKTISLSLSLCVQVSRNKNGISNRLYLDTHSLNGDTVCEYAVAAPVAVSVAAAAAAAVVVFAALQLKSKHTNERTHLQTLYHHTIYAATPTVSYYKRQIAAAR